MEHNQFEFSHDDDPEFDKALAEAAASYDQPAALKKKRSLGPDVTDFFAPSPVKASKDERNYEREIEQLENTIAKLNTTIKSLKDKKRNKTEDKELKLAEIRLKKCEDDLFFTTNARNFSVSNN